MKHKYLLLLLFPFIVLFIIAAQYGEWPEFAEMQTQVISLNTRVYDLEQIVYHTPSPTNTITPPPTPTIEVLPTAEPVCMITAEVTANKLNVRNTPNGKFIRQISRGQKVTYVKEDEYETAGGFEWVRIDYGEWVAKSFLKDLATNCGE